MRAAAPDEPWSVGDDRDRRPPAGPIEVSLVIPAYNEAESIAAVLNESAGVLENLGRPYEILAVDDGSTDRTAEILAQAAKRLAAVRVLTLARNSGQSAAFGVGFRACRGRTVVLMDGDGQNDPRDIPRLLEALADHDACCGYRAARRDPWAKRLASRLANAVRQRLLRDGIRDTGCSLKAIKSEWVRDLPMELRGMHRFLPALLQMRRARVAEVAVNHRPRAGGKSKYTNLGRLSETIWDVWAVRWMQKRYRPLEVKNEAPRC